MDMASIQSGSVGMALFDTWMAQFKKASKAHKKVGSPLLAAVSDAFEQYIQTEEIGMAAQISSVATYALNPSGASVKPVTSRDMAPFLALNVMA